MTEIVQQLYPSESTSLEGGQFNQAWKKLKQAQKRQARFEVEFDQVVQTYCVEVLPKERAILLKPCIALVDHLIPFLTRKTLTQEQRESLLNWLDTLIGNLSRLDNSAAEEYRSQVSVILQQFLKPEKLPGDFTDSFDIADEPEPSQFSDEVESKSEENTNGRRRSSSLSEQDFSFESMTKSPWFTSLFRKTAQALHPDREQDEQKRAQKEVLMAELVSARKEGHVLKVLELHTAYVCDAPSLSQLEMAQVIRLIQDQTRKVKHKKEDYILRQPERAFAYDRIYAKTTQRQKQNIKDTIQDFYELRDSLIYCRTRIKSISSLTTFLY